MSDTERTQDEDLEGHGSPAGETRFEAGDQGRWDANRPVDIGDDDDVEGHGSLLGETRLAEGEALKTQGDI